MVQISYKEEESQSILLLSLVFEADGKCFVHHCEACFEVLLKEAPLNFVQLKNKCASSSLQVRQVQSCDTPV